MLANTLTDDRVQALSEALERRVDGEVRFDAGSRGAYATDGSNYRQVPIGVVVPRTTAAVVETVAVCREHRAPVLGRGGGTSLAGQSCNVGVVIDFSKYLDGVLELDPDARTARVQPGAVLDRLRDAAEVHGLTFGPDPSTHTHCTLGGMIGNNSCGVRSLLAGRTADNVVELEVLTYDGERMRVGATSEEELAEIVAAGGRRAEIYADLRTLRDDYAELVRERFPDIPRRVSGYTIDALLPEHGFHVARALVGSESTCVLVLEATVRLVPSPPERSLVVVGYPDVFEAADHVPAILAHEPTGLEGLDSLLIAQQEHHGMHTEARAELPDGEAYLLVELGGETREEALGRAERLCDDLGDHPVEIFDDPDDAAAIWEVREAGLGATARTPGGPDTWEGWEDSAVPPERLGDYLRDLKALYARYDYDGALYGHFGDGCVHTRTNFDLVTAEGVATFRSFLDDAADLVLAHGGSLSGEHGDGQSRAELLPKMYGEELVEAFRRFKGIWDPLSRMNPGKVVDPYAVTENLRLGPDHAPWEPETHFGYTEDDGSFARATKRCVGVGACRKTDSGTMCPSYMVTREEEHSTRGRARLLFEMVEGEVITDGWRSQEVHDALDLCLACKGCFNECPVNVDMATYKAEFWSHHYRRRLRPLAHYSMGLLPLAARVIAKAPRLVNAVTQHPRLGRLATRVAGLTPERRVPAFAPRTLRQRLADHAGRARGRTAPDGRERVLLWADTFTNHLEPDIGVAAAAVLEDAGFEVVVPDEPLCCGLPMITLGMLDQAERQLRRTVDTLADGLAEGMRVVGLEPSCTAALRHDLTELLPHDHDARRLAEQTVTFSEILLERVEVGWRPPQVGGDAILQGHCHAQAIMGTDADDALLAAAGVDAERLDSGCCGLAGSFGFEPGHYDVSMACAERVLLPRVREAPAETAVLADGFSCRTQIEHGSGRPARHVAEVLAEGLGRSA